MKTLHPLGDLSVLPREIRDQIYALVMPSNYIAVVYYRERIFAAPAPLDCYVLNSTGCSLAILRSSKQIHDEAMTVFYSPETSSFHLPLWPHSWVFPPADVAQYIMNVGFSFALELDTETDMGTERVREYSATTSFGSVPAGIVALFQGNSVQRKWALIQFETRHWPSYTTRIIPSPLFDAIKQPTGFRTVTLKLSGIDPWYCPPAGTSRDIVEDWTYRGYWEPLCAGMVPLLDEFTAALEPTLGIGVKTGL